MGTHPKYGIYSNPYASRKPYDASICCDCENDTGLGGNSWDAILCLDCFTQAHYPYEEESVAKEWYYEYTKHAKKY